MKSPVIRALPALALTLLAAGCSSSPQTRYTPGDIDPKASDASGTAIHQAETSAPAQAPPECKDSAVKTRVDACNPPKGTANPVPANPVPANPEAAPVAPADPTVPATADPPPR
jgi:hypothetical protein